MTRIELAEDRTETTVFPVEVEATSAYVVCTVSGFRVIELSISKESLMYPSAKTMHRVKDPIWKLQKSYVNSKKFSILISTRCLVHLHFTHFKEVKKYEKKNAGRTRNEEIRMRCGLEEINH